MRNMNTILRSTAVAAALAFAVLAEASERPNILFIAYDDLRPLIKAYGEPEPITPHLDALANEGVRFDRNYVAYPLCNPSRATMLTGIRFDNRPLPGETWKAMSQSDMVAMQATWPRVLREAGYWTAARGKIYHSEIPKGDKSAWDIPGRKKSADEMKIASAVVESGGKKEDIENYLKNGKGSAALAYFMVDGPDNLLNDGQICDDVISYIKEKRDPKKPFAIACGFLRPHMPWAAPKKYFDRYPEDAGKLAYIPEGADKKVKPEDVFQKVGDAWNEGVDDKTAQQLIRGYMASTSYADAQMGKIINALKEEGLYDNTIIVVWGDHGYHLTDHGIWRKNTEYNISLRSPLIMRVPGGISGESASAVVSNVDLYPTLLELAGVAKPKDVSLHGKSLAPLLQDPNATWDNIVYTCAKQRYGLVTDRYRFTISEKGPSLYDLKNDPHEWNDLGKNPNYAEQVKAFTAALEEVPWNSPTGGPIEKAKPEAPKNEVEKKPAKELAWFSTLDSDKNGAVSEAEWLKRVQVSSKKKNKPYNEAQVKKTFARIDADSNGSLSHEELEKVVRK